MASGIDGLVWKERTVPQRAWHSDSCRITSSVPGSGFGRAGHFRIALCTQPEVIDRALPVFDKVLKQLCG